MRRRAGRRPWRSFDGHDAHRIQRQLRLGSVPRCPCCDGALDTRPRTRMTLVLPPGAHGFDFECRCCRRFLARVVHSAESLYLMRVQRLAAAVLRA